jgi:hypothetical protein
VPRIPTERRRRRLAEGPAVRDRKAAGVNEAAVVRDLGDRQVAGCRNALALVGDKGLCRIEGLILPLDQAQPRATPATQGE